MNEQSTELKLYGVIKKLHEQANISFQAIDVGITLSKMTEEEQTDLLTMIKFLSNLCTSSANSILADVVHDLNGLKAGFLDLPEGCRFSPRSSGYTKRVAALP